MNRYCIERKCNDEWENVSATCEDIHGYYLFLPDAVDDFEKYVDYMNDGHSATVRLVLIGLHRKTVLRTAAINI